MEIVLIIMSMLAVWRAAHILQEENGPWAIFARLQALIASFNDKPGSINDGYFCFYCMSMWISWIPAIMIQHTSLEWFFIYWFGISAGAIFLNTVQVAIENRE